MSENLIKIVEKSFKNEFKIKPLLVFSPGRINLIGEHTDYNDGFVFPAAINKGIALAISKSESETSTIIALDKNEIYEFEIKNIKPLSDGGWKNYILGVISELQKLGKNIEPFKGVFSGNIPDGAGLSSSAALENSFVFGLNELFNLGLSKRDMIFVSQKAEHNYAGVKCGIMDQYASMFGVKKSALLLDCRTIASKSYKIDFKTYKLMLINTNVKHNLSESAYNERRTVCEKVSEQLGVKALRDVAKIDLDRIQDTITTEDYQKALYVIEENKRVKLCAKAIKAHDLETIGNLLFQSHNGLRNQYKVSCDELDFLVDMAKESNDVLGSRMMGGGFGGCTINLVKKNTYKKYKKQVSKSYTKQFGKKCSIYKVKLSQGTRIVKS